MRFSFFRSGSRGGFRLSVARTLGYVVAALATLLLAEALCRLAMSSDVALFSWVKNPALYADYLTDDDYWKLYYRFGGAYRPPEHPHPALGWTSWFDRQTYVHRDAKLVRGRTPVLLYGDSFAACAGGVRCFEDYLNGDAEFAAEHYLLNYGVGGYGVDQIYLLLARSLRLYERPYVVFSLMTKDLDRCALSVRTGQKPHFRLQGEELVLGSEPIEADAAVYFAENPPRILSYVYAMLIHGSLLPARLASWLRHDAAKRERLLRLNARILSEVLSILRRRRLEFVFLVFHPEEEVVPDDRQQGEWRSRFLADFLTRNQVPYIWSRDVILGTGRPTREFFQSGSGHPSSQLNRLLSQEIRHHVLSATRLEAVQPESESGRRAAATSHSCSATLSAP